MSSVLGLLSQVNPLLLGAAAGALGAIVGFPLGRAAERFVKWPHTATLVTVLFVVGLPRLVVGMVEVQNRGPSYEAVLEEMKKYEVFQALVESYPESGVEIRAALEPILKEMPKDTSARVEVASRVIISKYVNKSIAKASDATLVEMLSLNALNLSKMTSTPQLCVDYYLGRGSFVAPGNFTSDDVIREGRVKAALLRSAVKSPSMPEKYLTSDEIGPELLRRYKDLKLDVAGLTKVAKIAELDPVEGCRIATDFSKALAGTEDQSSALLVKSLMKAGETP